MESPYWGPRVQIPPSPHFFFPVRAAFCGHLSHAPSLDRDSQECRQGRHRTGDLLCKRLLARLPAAADGHDAMWILLAASTRLRTAEAHGSSARDRSSRSSQLDDGTGCRAAATQVFDRKAYALGGIPSMRAGESRSPSPAAGSCASGFHRCCSSRSFRHSRQTALARQAVRCVQPHATGRTRSGPSSRTGAT